MASSESAELRRIISWSDYQELVSSIASQLGDWEPEAIVGLTRGGLVPAVSFSHMYNAKLYCLNISLRDGKASSQGFDWRRLQKYSRILIVDDINDTGRTLCWIKDDWQCDEAWGNNVRTACLIDNAPSQFDTLDYTALEINKEENPVWIVFPWEGERDYGKY